ncbi:GTP-binding protein [Ectobacillus panaciterrae]|uniref:GTP-binding protein n=1 Tax=Ectobacillus panaciterrae TaxID=363872 RepID=UPI00138AF896
MPRYKGIRSVAETSCRVVFQGIHMLFAGQADREWKDNENRTSEMVVIGRNLNPKWF